MGIFDRIFRRQQTQPDLPPVPRDERIWVGDIVGLLMGHMHDFGVEGMEQWTIVIEGDGEDQYVALYGGLPGPAERAHRHCILGDCERLEDVKKFYPKFGPLVEPFVQDLAFEICKRAEPRWHEIVSRQYA